MKERKIFVGFYWVFAILFLASTYLMLTNFKTIVYWGFLFLMFVSLVGLNVSQKYITKEKGIITLD